MLGPTSLFDNPDALTHGQSLAHLDVINRKIVKYHPIVDSGPSPKSLNQKFKFYVTLTNLALYSPYMITKTQPTCCNKVEFLQFHCYHSAFHVIFFIIWKKVCIHILIFCMYFSLKTFKFWIHLNRLSHVASKSFSMFKLYFNNST